MNDTQRGNRLGPYRLGARYRSTGDLGRVYRAHNVETGAPALVLQRTERQADDVPLADWQVRVTSSVSPAFLALEVESAPASGVPADIAEEFVVMLGDAEKLANEVVDRPETMPHLRRYAATAKRPDAPAALLMGGRPGQACPRRLRGLCTGPAHSSAGTRQRPSSAPLHQPSPSTRPLSCLYAFK